DSACITPPISLSDEVLATVVDYTVRLADAIRVKGLINVQYVVKDGEVLVIEANPRASRTVPYLSKAIGHPLAKYAALVSAGRTLVDLGFTEMPRPTFYSVKEVVLPFLKFAGVPPLLGPEMRSTGESMGIDTDPYLAYYKAQLGANVRLPDEGRVRLVGDGLDAVAARAAALGFEVVRGVPDDLEAVADDALVVDVEHGSTLLRRALEEGVAYVTSREAAAWTVAALEAVRATAPTVRPLQDLYPVAR
ncbi:MAG: carbamoyl phosphate synthase large subunit, partial [Trueperaceae bacterium]|nr:carbamoyl phosphate synthase large subunit [Trueperaceae bacterium]